MAEMLFNGKTKWVFGGVTGVGLIFSAGMYVSSISERVRMLERESDERKPLVQRFLQLEKQVEYNRMQIERLEREKSRP